MPKEARPCCLPCMPFWGSEPLAFKNQAFCIIFSPDFWYFSLFFSQYVFLFFSYSAHFLLIFAKFFSYCLPIVCPFLLPSFFCQLFKLFANFCCQFVKLFSNLFFSNGMVSDVLPLFPTCSTFLPQSFPLLFDIFCDFSIFCHGLLLI